MTAEMTLHLAADRLDRQRAAAEWDAEDVRAAMHPGVGRALAGLLRVEADLAKRETQSIGQFPPGRTRAQMLVVARAILGVEDA